MATNGSDALLRATQRHPFQVKEDAAERATV
jgi:hypothetical protein